MDDELSQLRERAYGPEADIHLDATAAARLHVLEVAGSGAVADLPPPAGGPWTSPIPPVTTAPVSQASPSPPVRRPGRLRSLVDRLRRRLRTREARLQLLWVCSLVVSLVVAWAAVTVVQRVQSAPLTPAAEQIARLQPVFLATPLPGIFNGEPGSGPSMPAVSFGEYGGLAVVVSRLPVGARMNVCVNVYDATRLTPTDDGFSGHGLFFAGCDAGAFPAVAQWVVTEPDGPASSRDEVPEGDAVQFVYDASNNEVVVFRAADTTTGSTP